MTTQKFICPAISVIIPLYNVEKYVGECLDSLLAQTFTDFEVIVVDDCSTDSSPAIVENYAPKFDGRLKLTKTEVNSGGGGYVPRNIGLTFAKGEYIYFVDSDDTINKNALEILYAVAKDFDTDVVYMGSYYCQKANGMLELISDKGGNDSKENLTLSINDPNKNLYHLFFKEFFHMPWAKFVKKKFLVENEISFPEIISGGDFIWTIHVFGQSKNFLRLPEALYFYREVPDSLTRKKLSAEKQISKCVKAFLAGTKAVHDLSDKMKLLKNPIYFRAAINAFFISYLARTFQERIQMNTYDFYEILYREFDKENDLFALLVPFFLSTIDSQQKSLIQLQQNFNQFSEQTQRMINELEEKVRLFKSKGV